MNIREIFTEKSKYFYVYRIINMIKILLVFVYLRQVHKPKDFVKPVNFMTVSAGVPFFPTFFHTLFQSFFDSGMRFDAYDILDM
jgi:hypothetical protein